MMITLVLEAGPLLGSCSDYLICLFCGGAGVSCSNPQPTEPRDWYGTSDSALAFPGRLVRK